VDGDGYKLKTGADAETRGAAEDEPAVEAKNGENIVGEPETAVATWEDKGAAAGRFSAEATVEETPGVEKGKEVAETANEISAGARDGTRAARAENDAGAEAETSEGAERAEADVETEIVGATDDNKVGAEEVANGSTANAGGDETEGTHEAAEKPKTAEGTDGRKNSEATENEDLATEVGPEAKGNEGGTSGGDPKAVAANSGLAERPG
jgi:hypothetical protein